MRTISEIWDFKVAGTAEGITALQMDIKIDGITGEIMSTALDQARAGRLHILNEMKLSISEPRSAHVRLCAADHFAADQPG